VKSYGTEGRELLDTTGQTNFVPPQDTVHAYLLFRGQDIKDLHVHEKQSAAVTADTAPVTPVKEEEAVAPANEESKIEPKETKKETSAKAKTDSKENKPNAKKGGNQNKTMVGSGASLLNKKARGAKGDQSEWLVIFMHLGTVSLFTVCSCN
jgi:hypothetical protein